MKKDNREDDVAGCVIGGAGCFVIVAAVCGLVVMIAATCAAVRWLGEIGQ